MSRGGGLFGAFLHAPQPLGRHWRWDPGPSRGCQTGPNAVWLRGWVLRLCKVETIVVY